MQPKPVSVGSNESVTQGRDKHPNNVYSSVPRTREQTTSPSLKDRKRSFATAQIRLQQITPSIRSRPLGGAALAGNTWVAHHGAQPVEGLRHLTHLLVSAPRFLHLERPPFSREARSASVSNNTSLIADAENERKKRRSMGLSWGAVHGLKAEGGTWRDRTSGRPG
jgi:hypothetical protein